MEILNIKIAELKFAEYNPRVISDQDFAGLILSLKTYGFIQPVVVNKDMTIIGGHQRVRAWEALQNKEVPCVIVDLDKEAEKKLNIALNKIQGDWDNEKLTALLKSFDDISLTGFTDNEMYFLDDAEISKTDDDDDEKSEAGKGLSGNQKSERNVLSFYIDSIQDFEDLHEYFGGKQDHSVEKLKKIVALAQDNGIE